MKKLWVNTVPGRDLNADQIFHFHQELPKYLRGFHKCTKEDAVRLAALILRTRCPTTTEAQSYLQNALKELIPVDMVKAAGSSDWKKGILAAYVKDGDLSPEEAKQRFLQVIYEWPTFGSTFFEVKQTTEPSYPEIIVVAINKNGVNIIHPQTKVSWVFGLRMDCFEGLFQDILATHEFSELSNWSSGNTFFHLTVGNMMRKTKILFETSQGYKMDDLITSYTEYFKASTAKQKGKDIYTTLF